jgi:hypothetical protein
VAVALEVDHDPIAYTAELVGSVGVRKQRGEVPAVFVAVSNWRPGGALRVIALGGDAREIRPSIF